ncbi:MAG: HPP family protein [Methylovulum sp.]|nr:HPP family protein [Methylovulum sp.]
MMNINQLIRCLPVDPVNLSLKGKCLSVIACAIAILSVALATQALRLDSAYPMIVASMGASAVILFIIPTSPLAQPWPLVGGHIVSAVIGVFCATGFADTALASVLAVGGSVLAMLLLRCLHPPGAATALAPLLAGDTVASLGYGFVLMPVGLNVAVMLIMAFAINRRVLGHQYPVAQPSASAKNIERNAVVESRLSGISEQDLGQALENLGVFIDITPGDLSLLLNSAQRNSFKRYRGHITCADIMDTDVHAVEFGTEVEDAWQIMCREKRKALPVIDKSRRVIGIVTWSDFFKFINLSAYENFQEKFRAFIRRTHDICADKPEAVGQIMTAPVTVLPEDTHIVDLIPLMSNQGYRQIPIVNHENRLVGMVYQAHLIAALYNNALSELSGDTR